MMKPLFTLALPKNLIGRLPVLRHVAAYPVCSPSCWSLRQYEDPESGQSQVFVLEEDIANCQLAT